MFIPQMAPDARFHESALAVFEIGERGSGWENDLTAWAL